MNQASPPVNTVAPLRNVNQLAELIERVLNRKSGLPGLACFYGFSGYGKSFAAIYASNKYRAYHIQVKSVWNRKKLCTAILIEMGIKPAGTIPDMVDQIAEELALSGRPLIVDEADFLVSKGLIEIVRDLYESSQAAIILIGEENLPASLKRWERIHGRMLDWVAAQPGSLADTRHLAKLYAPGIEVADDLLIALHEASAGSVRRICINLDGVRETAQTRGVTAITRAEYTDPFFTGIPPTGRKPT